jgi:lipopolysaccharide export system protein LptC
MALLLTPNFQGNVWYKKEGANLIVYGEQEGEVSYRLSAPRIDHKKWGNLSEDQNLAGIDVDKF